MKTSVPDSGKGNILRTENERKALDLILRAIREIRYGTLSIVLQDGLVIQVERSEKVRLLTRRQIDLAGEGDGI